MWKIYRKTIFPRWYVNHQNPGENTKNPKHSSPKILIATQSSQNGHSNEGYGKQHADKQDKKFWDDPQFHFHSFRCSLLETAGWLGTAVALCLNIHIKHIKSIYNHDKSGSLCIFRRQVFSMPLCAKEEELPLMHAPSVIPFPNHEDLKSSSESFEDFRQVTSQYRAAVQNSVGIASVKTDEKKAFRHFQRAARLGSGEGLYNLGLCYELGKGTRVNLNRAAFCYRKAATKEHGLAMFNLAVYFSKGLGGLPIDKSIAKLLFEEAADRGVPEAQTYIGLECLEDRRWSDAFAIFNNLAKTDSPEGKYYLGICYENGWGTNKEEKIAAELFSESASLGNQKAILKLGTFYEEGKGGCDIDCDFAKSLYHILIDQGCDEGQKALAKLKKNQQNMMSGKSSAQVEKHNEEKSKMHFSSSVPELSKKKCDTSYVNALEVPTSPYLDLITPYFSVKTDEILKLRKTTFYIGESKPDLNIPSLFIPSFQNTMPQLMVAKI